MFLILCFQSFSFFSSSCIAHVIQSMHHHFSNKRVPPSHMHILRDGYSHAMMVMVVIVVAVVVAVVVTMAGVISHTLLCGEGAYS